MLLKFSIGTIIGLIITSSLVLSNLKLEKPQYNIQYEDLTKEAQAQIGCLTNNLYYEARGESEMGQKAVAFVTLNRVAHDQFPKTICEVVTEKTGGTCQFSWVCDDSVTTKPIDNKIYHKCRNVALKVYMNYGEMNDITNNSLFYHATSIKPNWDWSKLKKQKQIGSHKFYTLKTKFTT